MELHSRPESDHEHLTLLQVTPDGRLPAVLEGGKRTNPMDNEESQHRKEHGSGRSRQAGFFQRANDLFAFVTQPHHNEVLPLVTKLVYGTFIGLYVLAAGSFSRRGVWYRDMVQELPEPRNLHVHTFCMVGVSALAICNLLVLLNVPFFLVVPWLYCGRFVAVTCWVAGFGHANGADYFEIARASVLAAAAVGELGASAVLAKHMRDTGVDRSIWPWAFFLMSCVGGLVAQQAVSSMSRNSLSWYEDSVRKRLVTVSQCVGYLGACYAMLWVVTEGKPMLSKSAEALSFGIVDTLFMASNGSILMRAVEQNLTADLKQDIPNDAANVRPHHAEPRSSAQCASEVRED